MEFFSISRLNGDVTKGAGRGYGCLDQSVSNGSFFFSSKRLKSTRTWNERNGSNEREKGERYKYIKGGYEKYRVRGKNVIKQMMGFCVCVCVGDVLFESLGPCSLNLCSSTTYVHTGIHSVPCWVRGRVCTASFLFSSRVTTNGMENESTNATPDVERTNMLESRV